MKDMWAIAVYQHAGVIQSLISTCKLYDNNPYTYLTDVLLRILITRQVGSQS